MLALILKWIVIALAVLNFGFMTFDGSRALIKGDYIRPRSGQHAGQLGPWSKLAERLGIDPGSTTMKVIFLTWGLAGCVICICYALGLSWAWKALLIMNIASLWYLWAGTASSFLQIILLALIRLLK